jgi:hypothetical protein
MPLKHATRTFFIEPDVIEGVNLMSSAKKKMGLSTYNMAIRIFTDFVKTRDVNKSGGYFEFAHIIGHSGQASKKDADHLWNRMLDIYGRDEAGDDIVHRILGTICMIAVAKDPRTWVYVEDM